MEENRRPHPGFSRALKLLTDYYDSLFEEESIILDRIEEFWNVTARFGDLGVFDSRNLMLVACKKPNATNVSTEEEWKQENVNVEVTGCQIPLIRRNSEGNFVIYRYYDISDTDCKNQSTSSYYASNLLQAIICAFSASDIPTYPVNTGAVTWNSWAVLQCSDLDEFFLEIRKPSQEELDEIGYRKILSKQFKSVIKTYCLYYFSVIEPDMENKPYNVSECDINILSNLVTILICRKYGISEDGDYEYMNRIPTELTEGKPNIKVFLNRIEQILFCFRKITTALNYWNNLIENPELAPNVNMAKLQEEKPVEGNNGNFSLKLDNGG